MMKRPILSVSAMVAAMMPLTGAHAADEAPARPVAFAVCAGCHAVDPGRKSFGPNLRGVVGRKAGSLPGYAYSDALKQADIVWTPESLDTWLTSPKGMVPGTRMPFGGYADAEKRRQIIEYLSALK